MIPIWGYGIAAAVAVAGGVATGWTVRDWKCEAAESKRLEAAAKEMQKAAKQMQAASTSYEQERTSAESYGQQAEAEIRTIYRNRVVAGSCDIAPDARRVLEASVHRANARASGEFGQPLSSATASSQPGD